MGAYFEDRALPPLIAFNAHGHVFDRTALARRVADTVGSWREGPSWPQHAYPSPGVILAYYEELRQQVTEAGGVT
eukprot:4066610-Alexandrium_andersonii.AAC.1